MAVEKVSIISDIWKLFYDRVKSQVTTVTITGGHVVNVKLYTNNFNDTDFELNTHYPVIIVKTPIIPDKVFTFGKNVVNGSIEVDLYTTQAESADKFCSQIFNAIETYRGTLAQNGLRKITIIGPDSDMSMRGLIKVHIRKLRFEYVYYYDKTGGAF